MSNRHKHADLIHAWCEGAEIEVRYTSGWEDANPPLWCNQYEYRIKPEEKKPVVRYLWAHKGQVLNHFASEAEVRMNKFHDDYKRLDWSRTEFP